MMEGAAEKKKNDSVKILDNVCKAASIVILLFMLSVLIVSKTPANAYLPACFAPGSWLKKYLIPIFSSAAVGYLTNFIAIWMLFRPYEKHWILPQGVIPRNKKSFGHELGILIPQHLLQPEKISAQIGKVALGYLKDPHFAEKVRTYVKAFLERNGGKAAGFLVPYVQDLTVQVIRDNLTYENFRRFCQSVVRNFMTDADMRKKTVQGAVALFRELLPGFSADLQKMIASRVAESFRESHPVLSFFKDKFSGNSVEDEVKIFWKKGERELLDELEKGETQKKLAEYFARALQAGCAWILREENAAKIREFLNERRESIEKYAGDYLAEKIPAFADEILSGDGFWLMLEEKALPALQLYVVKQLRGESGTLLAKIDLPGKIENAVDGMDMRQLHHFVVQASNDNLTLLQVFGFVLGGVAGLLMALVL